MKKLFKVEVSTTNALSNTFKMDEEYYDCVEGIIYIAASNLHEATQIIPVARSIECIGLFFDYAHQHSSGSR